MSSAREMALRAGAGLILVHLDTKESRAAAGEILANGVTADDVCEQLHQLAGELLRRATSVAKGGPDADPHPPGRVFLVHQVDAGSGPEGGSTEIKPGDRDYISGLKPPPKGGGSSHG